MSSSKESDRMNGTKKTTNFDASKLRVVALCRANLFFEAFCFRLKVFDFTEVSLVDTCDVRHHAVDDDTFLSHHLRNNDTRKCNFVAISDRRKP